MPFNLETSTTFNGPVSSFTAPVSSLKETDSWRQMEGVRDSMKLSGRSEWRAVCNESGVAIGEFQPHFPRNAG